MTNSLYTDKEVFIRELVSNACDALEKRRHECLTRGEDPGELVVKIETDEKNKTFTVTDTGSGMSKDELCDNLGVIARSGSTQFVEGLEDSTANASSEARRNVIGKFGVGFYSAFTVSDAVEVYSCTGGGSAGHKWSSTGDGDFEISACGVGNGAHEAPARGTRIVLRVKDSEKLIATSARNVETVLQKHSAFARFPVYLNDRRTNAIEALWMKRADEVSDEEATAFYRFIDSGTSGSKTSGGSFAFRLHFSTDAPFAVRALLFAPLENPERGFGGDLGSGGAHGYGGLRLYSRRVLISDSANAAHQILPGFLRFVRGAVDCEDLPLHVSRESFRDSALLGKLREILGKRIVKWLVETSKRDPEKYARWYQKNSVFLKEGICGDESYLYKESLVPLLRYETSREESGVSSDSPDSPVSGNGARRFEAISLDAYVSRMPEHQEEMYYLVATNGRKQAESSPYLEALRARGFEVLFLYAHVDEFVMQHVRKHKGKTLVSAEAATFEDDANDGARGIPAKDSDGNEMNDPTSASSLSAAEMSDLCDWFATEALPGKVTGVSSSTRLTRTPALLTGHEPEAMRRYRAMMTMMASDGDEATNGGLGATLSELQNACALELNPKHEIVKGVERLRRSENAAEKKTAALIAEQLLDAARISAGALDDPREIVGRMHAILEIAVEKR